VVGFVSDNVIRFDLSTGAWEEVIKLNPDDRPRGVAVDGAGRIYVGLRGGSQNVKRFEWDGTPLGDFTASIGGFGTGLIAFNDSGELIVAGDVSSGSSVFRYDGATGALIDSFSVGGLTNVVGLAVDGDFAHSAALFSGNIARYDLSQSPVAGATFVAGGGLVDRPIGMTVGHTGNFFVSSTYDPAIQEFDIDTGVFVGTSLDVSALGFSGVVDFHYDGPTDHYFLTTHDDSVYEIDSAGTLFATYQSNALDGAYAMTLVSTAPP